MNITLTKVQINNFLSIGEAEVDLDNQGYVLVKGVNQETDKVLSNGSGKSAIFDAIFWTICGETLRGTSDVVNEKSKSGCSCSVEFSVDGETYKIERTKSYPEKGSAVYFYSGDSLLSDQTKKSQEMISKVIPTMSPEVLGSIALLGQGLPYKFSSMTPAKRKDILDTMSGSSSQIDKLKYQLDKEESEYVDEFSQVSQDLIKYESEVSRLESMKEFYESQSTVTETDLESQIKDKEQEISQLKEDYTSSDSARGLLEEERDSLTAIADNVNQFLVETRYKISQAEQGLKQVSEGTCPTCGRPYADRQERLVKCQEYQRELDSLRTTLNILTAKSQGVLSQVNERAQKISDIDNLKSSTSFRVTTLQSEIENLRSEIKGLKEIEVKIKEVEDSIKSFTVKRYDTEKKKQGVETYVESVGYLKRQLSRDFKGYVLNESIQYLSSQSEKYGQYFFKDKKVNVTLSGNKILVSLGGRLYENLSGGERQRVDLSVQFALRDLLVVTSGFSCNMLVLDEAFDNLDAQGSNDLIELISQEFNDINSVFTVTHHTDISIPYDKTLLVVKNKEGISEVRVS